MAPGPSRLTRRSPRWGGSGRLTGRGSGAGRDRPEPVRDAGQHLRRLEIADGHGNGVVGPIIALVVAPQVVAADRLQVAQVADRVVMVRMDPERRADDLLAQQKGGAVLGPLPLRDDDRPLRLDLLRVEQGVDHAVGFDVQAQVDPVGGQRLEKGGKVEPGKTVHRAAVAGDLGVDLALGKGLRSFEQHVLGPVGDAGDARHLVAAADPVPDPESGHRGAPALLQDDGQAVVEGVPVDGHFPALSLHSPGPRRGR